MIRLLTALSLMLGCLCEARPVEAWDYERLIEEADLVVIARPTATNMTETIEKLPHWYHGPEPVKCKVTLTTFGVSAVLKGDTRDQDTITLRHLRKPKGLSIRTSIVVFQIDGPGFVAFDDKASIDCLLFLRRLPSGEFVAVTGQVDPDLSVRCLAALENPHAEQDGTGQPATRPESKSEGSDQTST